jgi:hypothetical protein
MNIGKPKRTIQVEPVESPVPGELPIPVEEEPPAPVREPVDEPVPAGTARSA